MEIEPPRHRRVLVPIFIKTIETIGENLGTILDVGCGELRNTFRGHFGDKYSGLELPGRAVPKDYEGNAEALPFPDNSFDVVTAWSVLEHLTNPFIGLTEMIRVARKTVFISTDFTNNDKNGDDEHLYSWTPKTLLQLLKKTGHEAHTWIDFTILFGIIWKNTSPCWNN